MSVQTFRWILAVPLAAWSLMLPGCGRQTSAGNEAAPVAVVVSEPVEQEVVDYEDLTGRTQASKSVDLRARVTGYLAKTKFKDGAEVKEKELLFEIDSRPYDNTLKKDQAEVTGFEARVKRLEADFQRAKNLLPSNAVTQEDYDKTLANLLEARSGLASAKASVDQANLNLSFTRIEAPIAGRIGRGLIDDGNLVTADTTLLANIVAVDPVYVYFNLDEPTMLQVQSLILEGKIKTTKDSDFEVYVGLGNEKGYPHKASVNFVNNQVDASTGTIRLRAVLPNPVVAQEHRRFTPGLFVKVRIPIDNPHKALLVTDRAIGTDQDQKFLYVLNDQNEVTYRTVKLGKIHDGLREIVEGLKSGERIVISNLQQVRPGVVVAPKPGNMRGEARPAGGDKKPASVAKGSQN